MKHYFPMHITPNWSTTLIIILFFSILSFYCKPVYLYAAENSSPSGSYSLTYTLYQNKLSAQGTHYYHTLAKQKKLQILLESENIPSFSFQLYTEKGKPVSTDNVKLYSGKIIISYSVSSGKYYLFTVTNLQNQSVFYSISLKERSDKKKTDSSQNKVQQKQTTIAVTPEEKTKNKRITDNIRNPSSSVSKSTTKIYHKDTSKNSSKTAQNNNNQDTSKTTKKKKKPEKSTVTPSIKISKSFFLLHKQDSCRLTVAVFPASIRKSISDLHWITTDSSIATVTSGVCYGRQPGITNISCYFIYHGKKITASCTVKVI
ncbi:MAG: hypothetical protein SPF70_00460 [Lachnospiraceae bacterium]|nr:hypothetical protein [Lachnospiraceae bacterium]